MEILTVLIVGNRELLVFIIVNTVLRLYCMRVRVLTTAGLYLYNVDHFNSSKNYEGSKKVNCNDHKLVRYQQTCYESIPNFQF